MMSLMRYADQYEDDKKFCCAWLPEGKSFVIRNPDEFSRNIVPMFFKPTKFSSFTRKLYRWGFRQINRGIGPDDPIIFGNEFFDRDNAEIMARMRSITAAGARKAEQSNRHGHGVGMMMGGGGGGNGPGTGGVGKRSYFEAGGGMYEQGGPDQKRLFDHYLSQKANHMMAPGMSFYGAATMGSNSGPLSIGNIPMRPAMGNGGGGVPIGGGSIAFAGGMDGSGHGSHSGVVHPQQYMSSHHNMMGGYNTAAATVPPGQKPYDMMQSQQSSMTQMQGLPHGMGGMSAVQAGGGGGAYGGLQQQMQMQQQMQYQMQMQMQQQMQQQQQQQQQMQASSSSSAHSMSANGNNNGRMMEQQQEHGSGDHGMLGGGGGSGNMDNMSHNGGMVNMGRHGGGAGGGGSSMNHSLMMNNGMMNNTSAANHHHNHHQNRMHTPSPNPSMMGGGGGGGNVNANNSPYPPNPQSTQEIVNAAIAALRYAN
jgi:HSF-type DNA-binding